jgi:hypothetical protein
MIDGDTHSAVDSEVAMGRSPEPELQADNEGLAKLCLWEADRTLDREAAQSMRALADRFKRMAEPASHDRR